MYIVQYIVHGQKLVKLVGMFFFFFKLGMHTIWYYISYLPVLDFFFNQHLLILQSLISLIFIFRLHLHNLILTIAIFANNLTS